MVISSGHPRALTQGPFLTRGHISSFEILTWGRGGALSQVPHPPRPQCPICLTFPIFWGQRAINTSALEPLRPPYSRRGELRPRVATSCPVTLWQRWLAWQGGH